MSLFRLIARLDIKAPNLIKGGHMEGLRVVGDPFERAVKYAADGADEFFYQDCVASLYGRNQIAEILERTTEAAFIPFTVCGGIRSLSDCDKAFRSGADKIAINTAALERPGLIGDIAGRYGSQAICVSVEAKREGSSDWRCYGNYGREKTTRSVRAWVDEAVDRGAGEILCTSIDMEGTRKGFDYGLIEALSHVSVPLVASGGCGHPDHVKKAVEAGADAVAVASCLHYGQFSIAELTRDVQRNHRSQTNACI